MYRRKFRLPSFLFIFFAWLSSFAGELLPYPSVKMDPHYIAIDKEYVPYFDDADRAESELYIKDGLFYHRKNNRRASFLMSRIFVISPDGRIYSARANFHLPGFKKYHSAFLEGGDVLLAGHFQISQGKLEWITNGSGHYKPSPRAMYNALKYLQSLNLDLSETLVSIVSPPDSGRYEKDTLFALEFLANYDAFLKRNSCYRFYH